MPFRPPKIPSSEITPAKVWLRRREFLTTSTAIVISTGLAANGYAAPLEALRSKYTVPDKLTPKNDVTNYNNF